MRRIMLIPLFIMTCTFSIEAREKLQTRSERSMTEIEISSLFINKELNISISQAVGNGWSVTGGASLRIPFRRDSATMLHIEDLGLSMPDGKERKDSHRYLLAMDYWPAGTFQGPVISIGVEASEIDTAKIHASAGYLCRISDSLKAGIRLSLNFNETSSNEKHSDSRLSLSLCYSF